MENQNTQKFENVIKDTRKNIRYIILASRKLNRQEMLQCVRLFNYDNLHLKIKKGESVTIDSDF